MPSAHKKFEPEPRPASSNDATFMPARLRQSAKNSAAKARNAARETAPTNADPRHDAEAVLLREFLRCDSVDALARSLAARIADGTSPEEFIAAAESAGPPVTARSGATKQSRESPPHRIASSLRSSQ